MLECALSLSLTTTRAQHVQCHFESQTAMVFRVVNIAELDPQAIDHMLALEAKVEFGCYMLE